MPRRPDKEAVSQAVARRLTTNRSLLADLLTTDLGGHGRGWSRSPSPCPASRSNRHSWTTVDVPDLATDLKVWVRVPPARSGPLLPGRLRSGYAGVGQRSQLVRKGPTRRPCWALCRNGLSGFTV